MVVTVQAQNRHRRKHGLVLTIGNIRTGAHGKALAAQAQHQTSPQHARQHVKYRLQGIRHLAVTVALLAVRIKRGLVIRMGGGRVIGVLMEHALMA